MFSKRRFLRLCVAVPLATAVACEQGAERLIGGDHLSVPQQPQLDVAAIVINVADVEQLYFAVNDPANAGAAITLAPGTYVLSATDGAGVARPNRGRLELQRDMSLYGVTGDRSAVVIDATRLPDASVSLPQPNQPSNRTAPVRIGRGSNSIEWLTVLGSPAAAAGIATELDGTASTRIRVAHVVSSGATRGVDVRNSTAANAGRRIDADIVENEFIGPTQETEVANGIRLVNFPGADGGVIVATMSGNRTHGYQTGCLVGNNRTSNATVQVQSSGDQFFANALGCLVMGGRGTTAENANSNSTSLAALGSEFVDNTASFGADRGGIVVVGGWSTSENVASHNTVSVALYGSKVSGNLGVNFQAFGARKEAPSGIAGTDNHVTIELHGVSKQIDVLRTASSPDSNNTNTVTVIQ